MTDINHYAGGLTDLIGEYPHIPADELIVQTLTQAALLMEESLKIGVAIDVAGLTEVVNALFLQRVLKHVETTH